MFLVPDVRMERRCDNGDIMARKRGSFFAFIFGYVLLHLCLKMTQLSKF